MARGQHHQLHHHFVRVFHFFDDNFHSPPSSGNNVVSYKSSTTGVTSQSSTGLIFDYTYAPASAPTVTANINAARTNAFYIINTMHDLAYRYGFTETAYNFQTYNFGKGGSQNDRVKISVQDSSGTNNANFATPADGQSGTCRMYIWTYTTVCFFNESYFNSLTFFCSQTVTVPLKMILLFMR